MFVGANELNEKDWEETTLSPSADKDREQGGEGHERQVRLTPGWASTLTCFHSFPSLPFYFSLIQFPSSSSHNSYFSFYFCLCHHDECSSNVTLLPTMSTCLKSIRDRFNAPQIKKKNTRAHQRSRKGDEVDGNWIEYELCCCKRGDEEETSDWETGTAKKGMPPIEQQRREKKKWEQ